MEPSGAGVWGASLGLGCMGAWSPGEPTGAENQGIPMALGSCGGLESRGSNVAEVQEGTVKLESSRAEPGEQEEPIRTGVCGGEEFRRSNRTEVQGAQWG